MVEGRVFAGAARQVVGQIEQRHLLVDRSLGLGGGTPGAGLCQQILEQGKLPVQPGAAIGRDGVADGDAHAAALGDVRLGGIVGGIKVEVGHAAEQHIGPAVGGGAETHAGHPFRRAVHPHMHNRMGPELPLQPAIEGQVLVVRGILAIEEQPHRVAGDPDHRLHADVHVAVANATQVDPLAAERRDIAGCLAPAGLHPAALLRAKPAVQLLHPQGLAVGAVSLHGGLYVRQQGLRRCRERPGVVAGSGERAEQPVQAGRHVEQRGGGDPAHARRVVVDH